MEITVRRSTMPIGQNLGLPVSPALLPSWSPMIREMIKAIGATKGKGPRPNKKQSNTPRYVRQRKQSKIAAAEKHISEICLFESVSEDWVVESEFIQLVSLKYDYVGLNDKELCYVFVGHLVEAVEA
jgi:hypothetical protein